MPARIESRRAGAGAIQVTALASQAAAAGLLGAMLLLPTLHAGGALLRRRTAAICDSLTAFGTVRPALIRVWSLGQQRMLAATLHVWNYRPTWSKVHYPASHAVWDT